MSIILVFNKIEITEGNLSRPRFFVAQKGNFPTIICKKMNNYTKKLKISFLQKSGIIPTNELFEYKN